MKEILLTSSVLIFALLILRRLFRNKISRRAQYALWGLVLLRLLIPVNLPGINFSVLTLSEPARESVDTQVFQQPVYVLPVNRTPISNFPAAYDLEPGELVPNDQSFGYPVRDSSSATVTTYAEKLTISEILLLVWKIGIGLMACWLLLSNLQFWRKLRKNRSPYQIKDCKYPVYLIENGLPSPCLFGLLRPAIYLTPASLSSPDVLRHVLAHEETHARHLDPLWALLRSVCLAIYWFNPLVWWASAASRTDCELACDEGALRRLGEDERIPYGRTLLSLIPVRKTPANPLLSATTMTADKRQLKDRISRIAENHKTARAAIFVVALIAVLVCVVTFTGAKTPTAMSEQEVKAFGESVFDGGEDNFNVLQFQCTLYDRPEEIDLYQLCHVGISLNQEEYTREEYDLVVEQLGGEAPSHTMIKISADRIDSYLIKYTGSPRAANPIGLDRFIYLPEYDAYYHFVDFDLSRECSFSSYTGEREGNLVRLYYEGYISQNGHRISGKFCLTLQKQSNGEYWFVSNKLEENGQPDNDLRSLTAEELAYFNDSFFTEAYGSYGYGKNRRAQFLTSLYDQPEDIDLFQLCYAGTPLPEVITPEEQQRVINVGYGGFDPGVDFTKISYTNMMDFLEENTGVSDLLSPVGVEKFTYLSSSNAYYHFHGDTNVSPVTFTAGTQDGDLIHLYYDGAVSNGDDVLFDSFHLTLLKRPNGEYWFLSNQLVDALPTAYPTWEPELTIPLDDAQPYAPSMVELKTYGGQYTEMLDGMSTGVDLYTVCVMRTENGNVHFGVQSVLLSSWPSTYFLISSDYNYPIKRFTNLFGHDGLVITYSNGSETLTDYYYFQEDGAPVLMLRTADDAWSNRPIDLDGDGEKELIAGPWDDRCIYFQRDGQIYQANLTALVENAWKEVEHIHFGSLDVPGRYLSLSGQVPFQGTHDPTGNTAGTAFRYLYFDGKNLRLYKDQRLYPNHIAEDIDVPADVQETAKNMVMEKSAIENEGWRLEDDEFITMPLQFDDWRISLLEGPYTYTFYDQNFQAWRVDYQFHTDTPEYVVLAGGRYVTEDGWVSPGYPGCDWLIFHIEEDSSRDYLYSVMANDSDPTSDLFWMGEVYQLEGLGLISLGQLDGPTLLNIFASNPYRFLNDLAERPETQRQPILETLGEFVASINTNAGTAGYVQWRDIIDYLRIYSGELVTEEGKNIWDRLNNIVWLKLQEESSTAPS